MRRFIKPLIIIVLVGFLGSMGYVIVSKLKTRSEAEQRVKILPDFTFYTLEDAPFGKAQLKKKLPVVIVHFDTDCESCQYEAIQIRKDIDLLKGVQVLMITPSEPAKVRKFFADYGLEGNPVITPLIEKNNDFFNTFGVAVTPFEMVYSSELKLVKEFKGEVKMEAIMKQLGAIK
jgi:peroxiredoxin